MTTASSRNRIRDVCEPVVTAAGYDLEGVDVTPAGRRRMLRIVIDRDDGVSLDDAAEVSRALSTALDASDVMGGAPYVLEVTSPGVDRALTEPRHWWRARGRLVQATRSDGGTVAGRVVDADEDGVTLDTAAGEVRYAYAELGRGRVQVEFDRPAGAGSAPAGAGSAPAGAAAEAER